MKFTLSWLNQFLLGDLSTNAATEGLDKLGLEVESVEDKGLIYANFVIAEIISTAPHPDAERLSVCQVYDGKHTMQIVCGAHNARAGIKVVLAPVGTIIPNGQFTIKSSKIRGIESHGMMCSAEELLLGYPNNDGIIELPLDVIPGTLFAEYAGLNEVVIDISLTPNRGDCASVLGIARDLSALNLGKLTIPALPNIDQHTPCSITVNIEDKSVCSAFFATYISGVKIGTIPHNIDANLRAIGSSKKLPLVDISNFMMLSYGHPNHIYDADKIEGNLTVRKAVDGEKFIAIGGEEYTLSSAITVIADDKKVLSIAGIIGGELSKVTEQTCNILVEVANFDPISIAKSGRLLNISTDSRFRFERRIDHDALSDFSCRLIHMIQNICSGGLSQTYVAYGNKPTYVSSITFDYSSVNKVLGTDISAELCQEILTKLGFECKKELINIPSWRQGDITIAEDLIEEIIRIAGYHHIPACALPQTSLHLTPKQHQTELTLRHRGLNEVISWSFISDKDATIFGSSQLRIKNPISIELEVMRASVLVHLLKYTANHINRGQKDVSMFELGPIYNQDYSNKQINCLAAIRTGSYSPLSPHHETRPFDFFDIKADLFAALSSYGFNAEILQTNRTCPSYYHPNQCSAFLMGKTVIAYCGRLHPSALQQSGIEAPVFAFELFIDSLPVPKAKFKTYHIVQNLQPVVRDFAFIVNQDTSAGDLIRVIKKVDQTIASVDVFDVYQGKGVAEGSKSIAVSVKLQPYKATLIDAEIEAISSTIINAVQNTLGGMLRGAPSH